MGLVDDIAQTYIKGGQQQAEAQRQTGQLYGSALSKIGELAAGIPQQLQEQKKLDLQTQEQQMRVDAIKRSQAAQQQANQVIAGLPKNDDGTYDTGALMQRFAQSNVPLEDQERFTTTLDKLNGVITSANKAKINHYADVANVLLQSHKEGEPVTPEALHLGFGVMKASGLANDDDEQRFVQMVASGQDPEQILKTVRGLGDKYNAPPKFEALPANSPGIYNQATGQVQPTGQPPRITNETEMLLAAGDPSHPLHAQAVEALKLKPATGETAAMDDQRYEKIVADRSLGKPIAPEDAAFIKAYEQRKTIGPEASAAAAADRQASSQAAQTAQQGRAQAFAESQAGRKELQDKVEQPFLDAREKADVLRGVVAAAKNGNMEAASVQSLLGTLGLVTTEGVKRINSVELENVAGAGNLWERLKGSVAGLTTGQKLSPKLQDDLLELSNKLEGSAYKKYQAGYTATTKRYGLKDEQPLPSPGTSLAAPAGPAPNLSGLAKGQARTFNTGPFAGQTWTLGADGTPSRVK